MQIRAVERRAGLRQRRFEAAKIADTRRAASLLDAMERDGIIGPPDGTKPRTVLVNREDYLLE